MGQGFVLFAGQEEQNFNTTNKIQMTLHSAHAPFCVLHLSTSHCRVVTCAEQMKDNYSYNFPLKSQE